MANSAWIELHLTDDTDATKNGQLLAALASGLRRTAREEDLHADTAARCPSPRTFFPRAKAGIRPKTHSTVTDEMLSLY